MCENLEMCLFLKENESDESMKYALMGFRKRYCHGELNNKCVRRLVGNAVGGPENVPSNMMPNGLPLLDTDDSDWEECIKRVVAELKIQKYR